LDGFNIDVVAWQLYLPKSSYLGSKVGFMRNILETIAKQTHERYGRDTMKALKYCLLSARGSLEQADQEVGLEIETYDTELVIPESRNASSGLANQRSKMVNETWTKYFSRIEGAKLFITTRGFMGVAPDWIDVNDTVAILCGGNVPYILRSEKRGDDEEGFRMISGCYIASLMQGEIEQLVNKNKVQLESITLY
jgi:hypothetical protein